MLESIVQDDALQVRDELEQALDTLNSVCAYCYRNFREVGMEEHRFVANSSMIVRWSRQNKAVGLTAISTREDCHLIVVRQKANDILGHRGLTRASHCQVTYTNSRHIDRGREQDMIIIQHITHPYSNAV
jgi:hypothetical protein